MTLYKKVLGFMTPYWKQLIVVFVLTLLYVLLNNLSLWISVDFIKELFDPATIAKTEMVKEGVDQTQEANSKPEKTGSTKLYKDIKSYVKSWLIKDTKQNTLLTVCLFIFLTFLFKNITFYVRRLLLNFIELKIIVDIRNRLHLKLLRIPLFYFDNRHTGDLNSVVFNDVNAIKTVLQTSFGKLILSPVQIAVNIGILFMISWKLTVIMLIIVPLSAVVMTKVGQGVRRRSRRVFKQLADVVSLFQEAVTGIRIVKAFANEESEHKKFRTSNHLFFKKMFRQLTLKFLTSPVNEMLFVSILIFLLWYGGNMVYSNEGLSAEDFIRFLIFLFMMFQPLKDLSRINNVLQNGMAAAERIFGILDTSEEVYDSPEAEEMPDFTKSIVYRNVRFHYLNEAKQVLRDVHLTINKGEKAAIVGPSGAGKTTLVNLLPRFYELSGGDIFIDDVEYRKYTLQSLRRRIGVVTQDTILFNDTVRANIAYGREDATEEEIVAAAKAANAWEFIAKMPQGLDTEIGEKGTRLSGGQKQRLSIARAILKNPQILILDEATSALDTESEQLVQEAIEKLLKNRTVLVIAHRLSTIQNADKIVVMQDGVIESIGRHSELLQKSPVYKNLHQKQLLNTGEKKVDEVS